MSTTKADPTPDAPHNYVAALLAWVARNPPPPARLTHMETLHDDWCGVFDGRRCHCQPEFRYVEAPR
jgi:hypothetical protein